MTLHTSPSYQCHFIIVIITLSSSCCSTKLFKVYHNIDYTTAYVMDWYWPSKLLPRNYLLSEGRQWWLMYSGFPTSGLPTSRQIWARQSWGSLNGKFMKPLNYEFAANNQSTTTITVHLSIISIHSKSVALWPPTPSLSLSRLSNSFSTICFLYMHAHQAPHVFVFTKYGTLCLAFHRSCVEMWLMV